MRLLLALALSLALVAPAGAQLAIPSAAGRDVVRLGRATGLTIILPGASAETPLLDLVKNAPQIGSDCAVTLRGGPRLGCYRDGKFTAQVEGITARTATVTTGTIEALASADLRVQGADAFWSDLDGATPPMTVLKGRVRIGAIDGINDARITGYTPPTAGAYAAWAPRDSDLVAISRRGGLAITGMSRTSDGNGLQHGTSPIGVSGFLNSNVSGKGGWGLYSDIVASAPDAGALGLEIAAKNASGTDVDSQPYYVATTQGVRGVWLAGGGDNSYGPRGTNHLDAAITIFKNGLGGGYTWRNGIVFGADGLVGTDGSAASTGVATAIRMARRQRIEWWTPDQPDRSGAPAVTLKSSVTTYAGGTHIDINDAGIDLTSPDGATTLRLAREAGGVKVAAVGAASDINASVSAKGKGLAFIGNSVGYAYVDGGGVTHTSDALSVKGGVGFNDATPIGKCTLPAALPTDGSASNAALATAINSVRSCLISVGLAQ